MLFYPKGRALFTGDALCTRRNSLTLPNRAWSSDWAELHRSIKKVMEFEFDILLPGHGPIITEGASMKVGAFIRKIWEAPTP